MARRDPLLYGVVGLALLGISGAARAPRLSLGDLITLARETGFADPELAAAVAMAESGGRPDAVTQEPHGSPSFGLWQIHSSSHPEYDRALLLQAPYNARAALAISRGGRDFSQWSTFKNNLHLPYLRRSGS